MSSLLDWSSVDLGAIYKIKINHRLKLKISKLSPLNVLNKFICKLVPDMNALEEWINTSCDTLAGNLGENATLLESVKLLDGEISVQKTHLVVSSARGDVYIIFT